MNGQTTVERRHCGGRVGARERGEGQAAFPSSRAITSEEARELSYPSARAGERECKVQATDGEQAQIWTACRCSNVDRKRAGTNDLDKVWRRRRGEVGAGAWGGSLRANGGAGGESDEPSEQKEEPVDEAAAHISTSVPSPASASVFACLLGGGCGPASSSAVLVATNAVWWASII